jgi:hypothetical protein
MAKDRANDSKRVFQSPMSHVNVLSNEPNLGTYRENLAADTDANLSFTGKGKSWKDKKFSDARGEVEFTPGDGNNEHYQSTVHTRGGTGVSTREHKTANAARQEAYNNASDDAVRNRGKIVKKGAEDTERRNKGRGKADVVRINTDPTNTVIDAEVPSRKKRKK